MDENGARALEELSDDELIRMYREGDLDAFDALFDRHYAAVYSFARTMLGDSLGPEEMLQEAFMTVARQATKYEPRGRFRPWLMRIVRNRCLNRLAAAKARREMLAGSGMTLIEPSSREPAPDESLRKDERAEAVRAAIAELPEQQRAALVLFSLEQLPQKQVAAIMGCSVEAVKWHVFQARKKLKAHLADYL